MSAVRGVWDITLAVDVLLLSGYYTNDERWEVTGRRGGARVKRCTGRGLQQPSLELHLDGEIRSLHALDDDWASRFLRLRRHGLGWSCTPEGPLDWGAEEAIDVLLFVLGAYESSSRVGVGVGVDPRRSDVESRGLRLTTSMTRR